MTFTIYIIRNTINGKIYIGKTKNSLAWRWMRHRKSSSGSIALRHAIKKYGSAAFEVSALYSEVPEVLADHVEKWAIASFGSRKHGYNLTAGGDGLWNPSQEVRDKISRKQLGKICDSPAFLKSSSANMKRYQERLASGELKLTVSQIEARRENMRHLNRIRDQSIVTERQRAARRENARLLNLKRWG